MRREIMMVLALTCTGAACDDGADSRGATESSDAVQLGGITISLLGADSHGVQYRLRAAEFLVAREGTSGGDAGTTPLETLSTELDPNAPYLTTRVAPGVYQVTLQGSWYIERIGDGGAQTVRAVLLSETTQRTHVPAGTGVARIAYRFGIDGDVVDFDSGELQVGVDIQLPRDAGASDAGADGGLDAGGADAGGTDAGGNASDAGATMDAGEALDASLTPI